MRKIVVMTSISVDGFMSGPNRELDWQLVDDERDMPKLVFSRTLERADWNSTIVREVDPEAIAALKAQPGGDLAVGGADLAAAFRRLDLVDEYRLYVHPVVLGSGKPLFAPSDTRAGLRLVGTRTFGSGVVLLRYQCTGTPEREDHPA
jgi:dihydrofolate reductase